MDWDEYFMNLLPLIASRSKDPNTQTGCVIVDRDNHIRATGYNSFPAGIKDNIPGRFERPEKYYWMEHAERNAIYAAAKIGVPLNQCRIYMRGLPCMDCARAIVAVGITEAIYNYDWQQKWDTPKYKPDFERIYELFGESGVFLRSWVKEE